MHVAQVQTRISRRGARGELKSHAGEGGEALAEAWVMTRLGPLMPDKAVAAGDWRVGAAEERGVWRGDGRPGLTVDRQLAVLMVASLLDTPCTHINEHGLPIPKTLKESFANTRGEMGNHRRSRLGLQPHPGD